MAEQIRIVIVDDHEVVREGLRRMLSRTADFEVVGLASDGSEAIAVIDSSRPDVLLLDLNLPGIHGLDLIPRIIERPSAPSILILTVHDEEEMVIKAVRGGAQGYVLKQCSRSELEGAIRTVANGRQHFDPVVVRALLNEGAEGGQEDVLTARELEILDLVSRGLTNRAIAEQLYLSIDTIKSHLNDTYRKLGVDDRAHAVAVALRKGLLQ
jgi:two-component system, NarL family, response regulator